MTRALFIMAAIMLGVSFPYGREEKAGWKVTQITSCNGGASGLPQLSQDGKRVYFVSNCNLAGDNRDLGKEIFKWEDGKITQLTHTSYCQIGNFSLSPVSEELAFITTCDINRENSTGREELALLKKDGSAIMLTRESQGGNDFPNWSSDGRYVVFESSADPLGRNADHSREVFTADVTVDPPLLQQISRTAKDRKCENSSMAAGGVVARCDDDFPGTAPDTGALGMSVTIEGRTVGSNPDRNLELFRFDLNGRAVQLTDTKGCENKLPLIQPEGGELAYVTDCGPSSSGLPVKEWKLNLLAGTEKRLCPDLSFSVFSMAWSGDGKRLALSSNMQYRDVNRERNAEIFIIDLDSPREKPAAVTDFPYGWSEYPSLSRDGKVVAFQSNYTNERENSDGNLEVFMAMETQPETEDE